VGLRPLTGGTDTHLVTADARGLGLTGRDIEVACESAGLLVGRCAVPFDDAPPAAAAGVRLGTACVTSQGMGPAEMVQIGGLVGRVVRGGPEGASVGRAVGQEVRTLLERFPAYSEGRE
jgi:glycine hydroxymethyltransferase